MVRHCSDAGDDAGRPATACEPECINDPQQAALMLAFSKFLEKRPSDLDIAHLHRFLKSEPDRAPTADLVSIDDTEIEQRAELMRSMRNRLREIKDNDEIYLDALQITTMMFVPLGELQHLIENDTDGKVSSFFDGVSTFLTLFLGAPGAAKSVEEPTCSQQGEQHGLVPRNQAERLKVLERDGHVCVITGMASPEVCHILPFALNSSEANRRKTAEIESFIVAAFGGQMRLDAKNLLWKTLGSSDKEWNMLSLSPQLRIWWSQGRLGLKCLGITSHPEISFLPARRWSSIHLQFYWMPMAAGGPKEEMEPNEGNIYSLLQDMTVSDDTYSITRVPCGRPVRTGQTFYLSMEREMAEKMKVMVDIQWAFVRIAAISGLPDVRDGEYLQ